MIHGLVRTGIPQSIIGLIQEGKETKIEVHSNVISVEQERKTFYIYVYIFYIALSWYG